MIDSAPIQELSSPAISNNKCCPFFLSHTIIPRSPNGITKLCALRDCKPGLVLCALTWLIQGPAQDGRSSMQLGDIGRQSTGSSGHSGFLFWILPIQAIASGACNF